MSDPDHRSHCNICKGREYTINMEIYRRLNARKGCFDVVRMASRPVISCLVSWNVGDGLRRNQGDVCTRTTTSTCRVDERRFQKYTVFAVGVTRT